MSTATASPIDYVRQRAWFDPHSIPASATIVGCGGIGSFAAFSLAKLGVQKLTLLDPDTVDAHNVPNQMYDLSHEGELKVEALAAQLSWSDAKVRTVPTILEDGVPLSDVTISALDSMDARTALWEQVKRKAACRLFLDGRLAGQNVLLYSVNPMSRADIEGYEATLYSDEEADGGSCTARSIIDVGFLIASLITRAVRMHYANEPMIPLVYQNQATLDLYKGDWSCR